MSDVRKDIFGVVFVVLIGKVIGFCRELIIAYYYGSSLETDAFFLASSIMLSLCSVITMGMAQAFIPKYIRSIEQGKAGDAKQFADKIFSVLLMISFLLTIFVSFFSSEIVSIFCAADSVGTKRISSEILRLMVLVLPFFVAFSLRSAILNSNNRYIYTAGSGIPYSLAIVIGTIVLYPSYYVQALVFSAIAGFLLQYIYVLIFSRDLYKFNFLFVNYRDSELRDYIKILAPISLTVIAEELNALVIKTLLSGLAVGSITYISYSLTLTTLVNGVFIVSITSVYYPHFVKLYARTSVEEFSDQIKKSLDLSVYSIVPISLFLFYFADDIVSFVYKRGSFNREDAILVSQIFSLYIIWYVIFAFRSIFKSVYFAMGDVKEPMLNECLFLILSIASNVFFIKVMGHGIYVIPTTWGGVMSLLTFFLMRKLLLKKLLHIGFIDLIQFLKVVLSAVVSVLLTDRLFDEISLDLWLSLTLRTMSFFMIYLIVSVFLIKECREKMLLISNMVKK